MAAPVVSVITATYNSSRTLRLALSSLRAQTFADWDAWVIGDGCTDDSESVVASFQDPRLHWVNLDHNHGSQAFANNEGLRRAEGRYIAYLGHDDLWMRRHLGELVRHLEDTGADLVHSVCGLFGAGGWSTFVGPPKDHLGYDQNFVPPSCWLHRRDLVDTVGYWRAPREIAVPVDFEYLRRVYRAGRRIDCCPQFTVLKFPSWWIGLYALQGDPPQAAYWQRMQTDPGAIERELVDAMATRVANLESGGYEPFPRLIAQAAGIVRHHIRSATEEWPLLSAYWRRRHQSIRRKMAIQRGLGK